MQAAETQKKADANPVWMVIEATRGFSFHRSQAALESGLEVIMVRGEASSATMMLDSWYQVFEAEPLDLVGQATTLRSHRFQEIRWRDRRLELRHEIECAVVQDGDLYVIEYEPLGIRAYANSVHAAKRDFSEEFVVIWEDYGLAPDEELAPGGIRLKRRLREIVDRETRADED